MASRQLLLRPCRNKGKAGNACSRYRSNKLIPALYIKYISKAQDYVTQKSL